MREYPESSVSAGRSCSFIKGMTAHGQSVESYLAYSNSMICSYEWFRHA